MGTDRIMGEGKIFLAQPLAYLLTTVLTHVSATHTNLVLLPPEGATAQRNRLIPTSHSSMTDGGSGPLEPLSFPF